MRNFHLYKTPFLLLYYGFERLREWGYWSTSSGQGRVIFGCPFGLSPSDGNYPYVSYSWVESVVSWGDSVLTEFRVRQKRESVRGSSVQFVSVPFSIGGT